MDNNVLIKIELGNSDMKTRHHLAAALETLAARIRKQGIYDYPIMDDNGNKVGSMTVDQCSE